MIETIKNIFTKLIEIYNKNENLFILSQMLLHINVKSIDTIEIKNKLEEMNLINPLIYLYMNGQKEDYFAPLKIMYDIYLSSISSSKIFFNDDDNAINYSKALTNKKITLKEVINCKEYYGHKILWYINMCLTGRKFPNTSLKMDKKLFDDLVQKIIYRLLTHIIFISNYFDITKIYEIKPKDFR